MINLGTVPDAFEPAAAHVPPASTAHMPPDAMTDALAAAFSGLKGRDVVITMSDEATTVRPATREETDQARHRERFHFRRAVEVASNNLIWVDDLTFDPAAHREIA